MGVLDAMIFGYRTIRNASNADALRRSVLKFVGATVTDDPITGATVITITGGGGSSVGANNAVQSSDGAGAFQDAGWLCVAASLDGANLAKVRGRNAGDTAWIPLVYIDGSDYVTVGNPATTYIQLSAGTGDALCVAGAYSWRLSGGSMVLSFPETVNAGTTTGETRTREDTLKTTAAPGTLATFVTTSDSMSVIDAELVALQDDGSIGMRAKIAIGVLNVAGVLTADTPDAPTPSFIGGAPAWTIGFNLADPNVTLDVDPGADTVSWYLVSSKIRTVVIP